MKTDRVSLIEVGPRDGLQNEAVVIETSDKATYITMLADAGFKTIEVTSFVRADRIPQMGDAAELFPLVKDLSKTHDIKLPVLVPNLKGLDLALATGVKEIAIFTAMSDEFNRKNINASVEESFDRLRPVCEKAMEHGIQIRGYLSTVFGCPYEGKPDLKKLIPLSKKLIEMGCYEVSLGDTIGSAHPLLVEEVVKRIKDEFSLDLFAMHFHDTKNLAVANSLKSFELGIRKFDASSGGLGGCPYAKGATGNVATEDMVHLFESMGIQTGIDGHKLRLASKFILEKLGKDK